MLNKLFQIIHHHLKKYFFKKLPFDNTDSQNENFFFLHKQISNFLKGHYLLVTNRPKKKFPSHVVFVGGVKICSLSFEEATAKTGQAF